MKFIYYLVDESPNGPALVIRHQRRFLWSAAHRRHILEGRELDLDEFNALAAKLYDEIEEGRKPVMPLAIAERLAEVAGVKGASEEIEQLREENGLLKAENQLLEARLRSDLHESHESDGNGSGRRRRSTA